MNLPFPSPLKVGIPRRFVIVFASTVILVVFVHAFFPAVLPPILPSSPHHDPDASYFSPSKWLPPILDGNPPSRPIEFDENGQCLFISAYDALSAQERARAEALELETVSPGIVRTKGSGSGAEADFDLEEFGNGVEGSNTSTRHTGLTHPILGLLRDGERKWNDRVARQSTTLEQAVANYKEKWGRSPPKGFGDWYVVFVGNLLSPACDMTQRADVVGGNSHRPAMSSSLTSTTRELSISSRCEDIHNSQRFPLTHCLSPRTHQPQDSC
jgi:beta-1,2-xylosyltransferase